MTDITAPGIPAISKTAVYVAAGRAVGAREPDPDARNPDYLAERLLGDPSSLDVDHPAVRALNIAYEDAMQDAEVVSNVRMMTVRTRFIDEALERAIGDGAAQVAILGAGFDSHAYRCEELLAQASVFEVDRPATQSLKKQRVIDVLGAAPENLTYVALDFGRQRLREALVRHGFDVSRRTFFILEGVTMYLAEEAVRDTLRLVAAHPAGSGIVFDFVSRGFIEMLAAIDLTNVPPGAGPLVERFLNLIKDEPWLFGIPADAEAAFLEDCGLELDETLPIGGDESIRRYLTRADGTVVGTEALVVAMQRLSAQARAAGHEAPEGQEAFEQQARAQRQFVGHKIAVAAVPSRH